MSTLSKPDPAGGNTLPSQPLTNDIFAVPSIDCLCRVNFCDTENSGHPEHRVAVSFDRKRESYRKLFIDRHSVSAKERESYCLPVLLATAANNYVNINIYSTAFSGSPA